jgi:glycosyltransferase involved in cell wall biosynthesis
LPLTTAPAALPRHVFMTTDGVGGIWTYALSLAQGLEANGTTVTLAVLGPPLSADQRTQAAGLQIIETGLPLEWTATDPTEVLHAGTALRALANKSRADLIHLNNPAYAAAAGFGVPLVMACHSCVATWWDTVRGGTLPPDLMWRRDMVAQAYARADILLAPSAAFADHTSRLYALPSPPMVVPNGMPTPDLPQPTREADFVFTAGRLWDEGKNIAVLEQVAPQINLPILAAGPLTGPNGAAIHLSAVNATGRLSALEIAGLLAAKPIFVSPARYEPFGLAVLEAAQAGCALVLSDQPGFVELWDDAAFYAAPDDSKAIAAAVNRLAEDHALRRSQGEAAQSRATRYSLDAMLKGTLAAYSRARQKLPAMAS